MLPLLAGVFQYKILLYYTKEKPVAFAKITSTFSFVVSENRFVNVYQFAVEC